MYYPIQIPYILDETFLEQINYREEIIQEISNFVICYWQMTPIKNEIISLDNIIILDGCVDLIVDFDNQVIGFSGMSESNFHFRIQLPSRFMGLRLMPATFHQLTGKHSREAMDNFLSLAEIYTDFNFDYFFSLSFNEAKDFIIEFIKSKLLGLTPNQYVKLFIELVQAPPSTVSELCSFLNLSSSQCQRNFQKYYGLSPKKVLSILRFQKSISIMTSSKAKPCDVLEIVQYYDQSHFINDFKRNIGITPLQLLKRYKND